MKKIALLFPGQGSQYPGMGKGFYESNQSVKRVFEEVSDSLGMDMAKLCFESTPAELVKTENTQPAILTVSVAMFQMFMERVGTEPLYLAGHSLGEFSALVCAGGIGLGDAAKIVRQRGRFMQEAVSLGAGAMAAISGIDLDSIKKQCLLLQNEGKIVSISNYNSPDQTVISGTAAGVEEASRELTKHGATVIPLHVSAPFHSQLMTAAADKLRDELEKYTYYPLKWPVISNVTALPYQNEHIIKNLLAEQMSKPVQWVYTMNYLASEGVQAFIELGPKDVLKKIAMVNTPKLEAYSFDKPEDMDQISSLSDDKPQTKNFSNIKLLTRSLAIAICTPNKNWDDVEYRQGVIEPYKRIERMVEELEQSMLEPTTEQMSEALEMLVSVFRTKRTPIEEQKQRFNQLISELGMEEFITGVISVSMG